MPRTANGRNSVFSPHFTPMLKYILLALLPLTAWGQLQTPDQFLGYPLGERFTRHHQVVNYFQHVDAQSSLVTVTPFGETYEHRPLLYAVVASPENFARLEQIRQDNLKRAGLLPGSPATNVALVWLSYNVHGNEASSTEAAMKTIYELANTANAQTQEWPKNTVVIMDPCLNPDGRDRYVNFYYQNGNLPAQPDPQAREHREPWATGRPNHYLFDMNRDWAWLTQQESRARIKLYNEWMPHVHVDFHEQGYNSPYYFAPAAEPYHEVISNWQREFQQMLGKNHAKYFDQNGWLYFSRERFDLYYPSYGDTYPTYSGAIGMTYEQGGIGAGLTVTTTEGDPITLKDRIAHHYTTGMSTIEVASKNAARLVDEFEKFFRENLNAPWPYKAYVIKASNQPDNLQTLLRWMDQHKIQYGHAGTGKPMRGFDYQTQVVGPVTLATDDIVIPVQQPKGRLITTLFEPQTKLADSLTYDITAWNLMYAYSLKGFAATEKIAVAKPFQPKAGAPVSVGEKPYAYVFTYQSLADSKFLAALHQTGIKSRVALKPFTVNGKSFDAGTLIVPQRNNENIKDFDATVRNLANAFGRTPFAATTGLVDKGYDFGSGEVDFLKAPRVALLGGDQTSTLSHGTVWHFFEQELKYPLTILGTDYFRNVDLWKYDVFIVPDGNYRLFDEATLEMVQRWVSDGGRLILMGNALNIAADKKGFALKAFATDDEKKKMEQADDALVDKEGTPVFAEAERREISNEIIGAIYKTNLDKTHPLAFGLTDGYFTLKTSARRYAMLEGAWNVAYLKGMQKPLIGFAGYRANQKLTNSLVFGVENKGRGSIVYLADDPMFRSFWANGKLVFANAVLMR